ncbi:hypothetical protein BGZ60DRAFT_241514 [Tricladium varicosporioides]|nr:hypothetical protein BGZ60DRAFT_241514 [Hymenoscyphus varicosporioides]
MSSFCPHLCILLSFSSACRTEVGKVASRCGSSLELKREIGFFYYPSRSHLSLSPATGPGRPRYLGPRDNERTWKSAGKYMRKGEGQLHRCDLTRTLHCVSILIADMPRDWVAACCSANDSGVKQHSRIMAFPDSRDGMCSWRLGIQPL